MPADTVAGLQARGHRLAVIHDSYQDFGAGQFIWRVGEGAGVPARHRPAERRSPHRKADLHLKAHWLLQLGAQRLCQC